VKQKVWLGRGANRKPLCSFRSVRFSFTDSVLRYPGVNLGPIGGQSGANRAPILIGKRSDRMQQQDLPTIGPGLAPDWLPIGPRLTRDTVGHCP
jgi:hypothetical protein